LLAILDWSLGDDAIERLGTLCAYVVFIRREEAERCFIATRRAEVRGDDREFAATLRFEERNARRAR
jgi:hypothetical protein